MKLILNNITDRPSSYNQLKDVQSSNIVRLVEDSEIQKTIRFDEMSIDNGPDPTTEHINHGDISDLGAVIPHHFNGFVRNHFFDHSFSLDLMLDLDNIISLIRIIG